MFADPLLVPIETSAYAGENAPETDTVRTFHLVGTGPGSSERRVFVSPVAPAQYSELGHPNTLRISHQNVGKGAAMRTRHLLRFDTKEMVDAPALPSAGESEMGKREGKVVASAYLVVDVPTGWEQTEQVSLLLRQLLGFLRGSSGAPIYWGEPGETRNLPFDSKLLNIQGWLNGMV